MVKTDYPEYVGSTNGMISGRVYDRREVDGNGFRDPRPFASSVPSIVEATYLLIDKHGYRHYLTHHVTSDTATLVRADAPRIAEKYSALIAALHNAIRENFDAVFVVMNGIVHTAVK